MLRVSMAPRPDVPAWGSYSAFSDIVRRTLVWLGQADPITTRDELEIFNEDTNELATVVDGLKELMGVGVPMTSGEILSMLRTLSEFGEDPDQVGLAASVLGILAPGFMKSPEVAIGMRLKKRFRDRPHAGFWLRAKKSGHKKQLKYAVREV